jgi:hypothetical protein
MAGQITAGPGARRERRTTTAAPATTAPASVPSGRYSGRSSGRLVLTLTVDFNPDSTLGIDIVALGGAVNYSGAGFAYTVSGNRINLVINMKLQDFFATFAVPMNPNDVEITYDPASDEITGVLVAFGMRITYVCRKESTVFPGSHTYGAAGESISSSAPVAMGTRIVSISSK